MAQSCILIHVVLTMSSFVIVSVYETNNIFKPTFYPLWKWLFYLCLAAAQPSSLALNFLTDTLLFCWGDGYIVQWVWVKSPGAGHLLIFLSYDWHLAGYFPAVRSVVERTQFSPPTSLCWATMLRLRVASKIKSFKREMQIFRNKQFQVFLTEEA